MGAELDALVAALPGNVWTTDVDAALINVDPNLLRIATLGSDVTRSHRWLDAINPEDLIDGRLLWRPITTVSPVATASFRLKAERGRGVGLRVLVAPAPADAGAGRYWIGTFFLDTPHQSDAEYVAVAILERIAALGGMSKARPATLAPTVLSPLAESVRTGKKLAAIVGCTAETAEALATLFELLGWRSTVVDRVSADLVLATRLTIIAKLSLVPAAIVRPYSDSPAVALLCREEDHEDRAHAAKLGCTILAIPIEITAIEDLAVALI